MKYLKIFVALIFLLGLNSCKSEIDEPDAILLEELKSSPDSVSIQNYRFGLEAFLWRDYQPISEPNGAPLRSLVRLGVDEGQSFPAEVVLKNQYVINGDLLWTASFDEIRNFKQNEIEGLSSGGPKWGPNITVEVVCEFSFEGETFRLIVKDQEIIRTD